jgi:hypothetical protein
MKFLTDVIGGRTYSLGRHYWMFMVVPGICINLIVFAFLATLSWDARFRLLGDLLDVVAIGIFFIGYVGLINCVRYRRRWRGWGSVAVAVTTLTAFVSVAQLFGAPETDQQIQREFEALNAGLPRKMDAATTLD